MATAYESIPGVGAPARNALTEAGYPDLESLDGADYAQLAALHGVGRRGLERLQAALRERGMGLTGEVPETGEQQAAYTQGHTGKYAEGIKTKPMELSPEQYIETLDTPRRVEHGRLLLELFNRVTGEEPVMWGPSMIGYGQVHYRYDTGREGDTFQLGFSPRKAKISLYGLTDKPGSEEKLARLGKHAVGASCLYINKPEDVDLGVLEEMIEEAWRSAPEGC